MSWVSKRRFFYFFLLTIMIVGCASSVSPILKYPLLKEGDKFATVTLKHAVTGPRSNITAFIITEADGSQKAYAPITTESIGKEALKAFYAWTPWGVATRMVHMKKGAIYHIPPIKMTIKLESVLWEGPIREYVKDNMKYQVWRIHRWESYVHDIKLDPDKEYFLNTPEKLYGKPILIEPSHWSTKVVPFLEIKKKKEEEIQVDEEGKQHDIPE